MIDYRPRLRSRRSTILKKNIYPIFHEIELSPLCLAPAKLKVCMLMCVTALKQSNFSAKLIKQPLAINETVVTNSAAYPPERALVCERPQTLFAFPLFAILAIYFTFTLFCAYLHIFFYILTIWCAAPNRSV